MTPTITAAANVPVQTAVNMPLPVETGTSGSSSSADLERLRALVANVNVTPVDAPADVSQAQGVQQVNAGEQVERSSFQTLGDSILSGIVNFNSGYYQSMDSINSKLDFIASDNPMNLGNNFSQMMGLQMEIARWSMSVMGVDNASKAGTNTIKELSKGA